VSDGKLHDVHALDLLLPEAGAIYVMDRGYVDFARLHVLHLAVARTGRQIEYRVARRQHLAPKPTAGVIGPSFDQVANRARRALGEVMTRGPKAICPARARLKRCG